MCMFEKEVISHSNIETLQARLKPFFRHLKAHKFVEHWHVFVHYSIATLMTN